MATAAGRLVTSMGGLAAILLAAPAVLYALDGDDAFDGFVARLHLFSYVVALSFVAVAVLVARHDPTNRLAVLAAAIAVGFGLASVLDRYGVVGYRRGWPAVDWVLWVGQWSFAPAMWAVPTLVVTLFPTGRLPSPRWRPVVWSGVAAIAIGTVGWALAPYGEADQAPSVPLDNPVATDVGAAIFRVGTALWVVVAVVSLAGLGRRAVRATGRDRAQLLWLLVGLCGAMVAAALGGLTGNEAIPSVGVVLLPASIAVGVVHVSSVARAERLAADLAASRARLVTAREEERRRIRRDLHDELGPNLAAIAHQVERAGLDVATDPDAAVARLDEVAERVRGTVREVRTLVEDLRPTTLDHLGLEGAVTDLVRRLGTGPLAIEVVTDGALDELPAAVEVSAYRIVAEAVTNVVRHSGARRAAVAVRRRDQVVEVVVTDDGVGIAGAHRSGVGRASMAERAEELGGTLTVEPAPGGGTVVRAVLPVVAP